MNANTAAPSLQLFDEDLDGQRQQKDSAFQTPMLTIATNEDNSSKVRVPGDLYIEADSSI